MHKNLSGSENHNFISSTSFHKVKIVSYLKTWGQCSGMMNECGELVWLVCNGKKHLLLLGCISTCNLD